MKILIIGSKGFIGTHCANRLNKNHEVWECDIISDKSNPRYLYIDPNNSDFDDIFKDSDFDICINCSGAANVPFSLERPFNDFQLNTINVFKILDAIRRFTPDCKYISLSSAAVYGNPASLPINEAQPSAPVSPYGIHKVMAEMICEEFHRFWNIGTVCIRIFSAYGPGLKKQLFWDLSQKIKNDDTIELFGTGDETRDFIYIEDLVNLIECVISNAVFNAEIINAANGSQVKIATIASLMTKEFNTDKCIKFLGANRAGDPLYWEADISTAKKLGYNQQFSLEKGIHNYRLWLEESGLV